MLEHSVCGNVRTKCNNHVLHELCTHSPFIRKQCGVWTKSGLSNQTPCFQVPAPPSAALASGSPLSKDGLRISCSHLLNTRHHARYYSSMAQPHNPTARFRDSCKVTYTENGESGVGTEVSLTPNPTPPPCLEQILSVSLNKGPLTFKWSSSLWGQQDVARD